MTLKEWMDARRVTIPQMAARLGCKPETVRRYMTGERIPDRAIMPLIAQETELEVTANDFFGITSTAERQAAA